MHTLSIFLVRASCFSEGEISIVSPIYDNYLNIFTGGPVNISGRVGVCRGDLYSTVCDVNWDSNDADVLCRSIGIRSEYSIIKPFHL